MPCERWWAVGAFSIPGWGESYGRRRNTRVRRTTVAFACQPGLEYRLLDQLISSTVGSSMTVTRNRTHSPASDVRAALRGRRCGETS